MCDGDLTTTQPTDTCFEYPVFSVAPPFILKNHMKEVLKTESSISIAEMERLLKSELLDISSTISNTRSELRRVQDHLEEALRLNKEEKLIPGSLQKVQRLQHDAQELTSIINGLKEAKAKLEAILAKT